MGAEDGAGGGAERLGTSEPEAPLAGHSTLGPGREFDLIRDLVQRWGGRASGLGDDAASLAVPRGERLVVSTDASVENVHFRADWLTPREIGYRATAAALSDLAAMAAAPLGVLTALVLPERWLPSLAQLADGIADAAAFAGTTILGGDLARGGELALAVTVLGSTGAPLARAGARAGDGLYVTGALGGPAAAVSAWLRGDAPLPEMRARFAHPTPRLKEARWLAEHGARAAIDISDGLLADAAHMAAAGGVKLLLELDALPTLGGVSVVDAARSGEEYELLVAAPPGAPLAGFERAFGVPLTRVGRVEPGAAGVVAVASGERVASPGGYSHF